MTTNNEDKNKDDLYYQMLANGEIEDTQYRNAQQLFCDVCDCAFLGIPDLTRNLCPDCENDELDRK